MSSEIELEINFLLQESNQTKETAIYFLFDIHNPEYSWKDKLSILHFALNTGAHQEILSCLHNWFKNEKKFPWTIFIETLNQLSFQPSQKLINSIFEGAQVEKAINQLALTTCWENHDPRFKDNRSNFFKKKNLEYQSKIDELRQKIIYLREEQLVDEEERAIKQLKTLKPNEDTAIQQEHLKERWARNIIQNFQPSYSQDYTNAKINLSSEEKKISKTLANEAKKYTEKNNEARYEFALLLYFSEFYSEALSILPKTNEKNITALKLELFYKSKQFIYCLDLADQLTLDPNQDTDARLNATYMKALSYWELHKQSLAIETLKSITNINPDFRSAKELLYSWTGRYE